MSLSYFVSICQHLDLPRMNVGGYASLKDAFRR